MNTIQAQWEDFKNKVIPANAPPRQIFEMRSAFYAGAHCFLKIMDGIASDKVPIETGAGMIDSLQEELRSFALAMATTAIHKDNFQQEIKL